MLILGWTVGLGNQIKKYWTAAATRFCEEQRAAHNVESQGYEIYLPEISSLTRSGSERRELLFPGYIFIRIRRTGWESLLSTRGIARLFMCQNRPTRVPEREINYFKDLEDERGLVKLYPPLFEGQTVYMNDTAGSFSCMKAVVQGTPVRNRVAVLIEFLGRSLSMEVDRRVLSAA